MQVQQGRVLNSGQRTAQAWFASSPVQCAASLGQVQILQLAYPQPQDRCEAQAPCCLHQLEHSLMVPAQVP